MTTKQINILLTVFAFILAGWILIRFVPQACANGTSCSSSPTPLVSPSIGIVTITPAISQTLSGSPVMSLAPALTAGATAIPIPLTPTPEAQIGTAASANAPTTSIPSAPPATGGGGE